MPTGLPGPDEIPGILAWWDPTRGVSLLGSNVTDWASQAGTAWAVSPPVNAPVFQASAINGLPAISFTAASTQFLRGGGPYAEIDSRAPFTSYCILRPNNTAAQKSVWCSNRNSGGFGDVQAFKASSAESAQYEVRDAAGANTTNTGAVLSTVNASYVGCFYDGTNTTFRVNAVSSAALANTRNTVSCDTFQIGARRRADVTITDEYFDGLIADVIFYDHVLTAGQIALIEAWAADRYAI